MVKEPIYNAATVPLHEAGVALFIGEEVFELLSQKGFRTEWDILFHSCPWATVFQSREFVTTWYEVYSKEYLPILAKAGGDGSSTGILAMALSLACLEGANLKKSKGRIVGAGQYEAEYQTWIAEESTSDIFIQAALSLIMDSFPKCDLHFRYLPPNVPLAWAEGKWRNRLIIQATRRPLMHMADLGQVKLTQKSEFRNKLNRLKRAGDFHYEQVTDRNYFEFLLPELAVQYDFRQGAMFNLNQFQDNPTKCRFLVALFEQDLLHVSVLKLKNTILASIVAVAGKDWVYLGGINTHEPFQAHYFSPGFVLFVLLGQQLAQQGYSTFDLTPGGDSYKERLATSHDEVYEMIVTGSPLRWAKRQVKKNLYSRLSKAGIRPLSMELTVKKKLYLLRHRARILKQEGLVSWMADLLYQNKKREDEAFEITVAKGQEPIQIPIACNSLSDLLGYEGGRARQSRWEFLAEAMRRLEAGERSYTWHEQGRLQACAWLRTPRGAGEEGAVLEGVYCHSAAREALPRFLQAVAIKVSTEQGLTPVYALAGKGRRDALRPILDQLKVL